MTQTKQTHKARTFFASIFGIFAVSLLLASLVIVWLNRTLTNTQTYVNTVAPLATKPEVQTFVAQKTSTELLKNAEKTELANALLTTEQRTDKNTDQLIVLLEPLVYSNVLKVVQSPDFAALWKTSNQTAHTNLIQQLDSNQPQITLELNPIASGVIEQLKATQLAAVSDQLKVEDQALSVDLSGTGIDKVRSLYHNFHRATWALVAIAVVCFAAAIIISTHHLKTLRRILTGTGVLSLLFAFSIKATSYITVGNDTDEVTRKAMITVFQTLFHNLFIASLIAGVGCIIVAIGLKVYSVRHDKLT